MFLEARSDLLVAAQVPLFFSFSMLMGVWTQARLA